MWIHSLPESCARFADSLQEHVKAFVAATKELRHLKMLVRHEVAIYATMFTAALLACQVVESVQYGILQKGCCCWVKREKETQ